MVYLAGPIKGLSYGACTDWRDYATKFLKSHGITALSPMRAKEHLKNEKVVAGQYRSHVLSSTRGIVTRDRWDVSRCDVMLANLLETKEELTENQVIEVPVSIGTMVEYGWADAYRKPVVSVMEREGNVHDHPMVQEITGFRVETLDEGLVTVCALLGT